VGRLPQVLGNLVQVTSGHAGRSGQSLHIVQPSSTCMPARRGAILGGVGRTSEGAQAFQTSAARHARNRGLSRQVETSVPYSFFGWASACWERSCSFICLIVVNFQSWLDPFIIITACREHWRESAGFC